MHWASYWFVWAYWLALLKIQQNNFQHRQACTCFLNPSLSKLKGSILESQNRNREYSPIEEHSTSLFKLSRFLLLELHRHSYSVTTVMRSNLSSCPNKYLDKRSKEREIPPTPFPLLRLVIIAICCSSNSTQKRSVQIYTSLFTLQE